MKNDQSTRFGNSHHHVKKSEKVERFSLSLIKTKYGSYQSSDLLLENKKEGRNHLHCSPN